MSRTADQDSAALASRYLEILTSTDLGEIFQEPHRYSGVFLAGFPDRFAESDFRILVVGKETKKWRDRECEIRCNNPPVVEAVRSAMATQQAYLRKAAGHVKFIQFVKQVEKAAAKHIPGSNPSVHWGNLFCLSHAGGSPTNSKAFHAVRELSAQLLRAQIEFVDPDVILFTTGHVYDEYVHSCFPDRASSRVIKKRCLWEFRVGRARCYRTSHPRYVAHNHWRDEALRLALSHV